MPTYQFKVENVLAIKRDPDTGAVLYQIGDPDSPRTEDEGCAAFGQPGLVSIATAAGEHKGCEVIALNTVDTDVIIAGRDLRGAKIQGSLKEGETCVYATKGQARCLFKADGNVTIYTTADNTEGGDSIALSVGPLGIKAFGPWGAFSMSSAGIQLGESGGAFIKLKDDKITISATEINLTAGSIGLGAAPSVPIILGPSGVAGAPSTCIKGTL